MSEPAAELRYDVFMALTFRLHEQVQRRLAARFPEPSEGGGPATFLRFTPIHAQPLEASLGDARPAPVPEDALIWPMADELRLWTWGGLHAALVEVACECGLTSIAPVYGIERERYLTEAAEIARASKDGAERVREAIREFVFPGEQVFGEAFVKQAYQALNGRFGTTSAAMLLRRMRIVPGLEQDFWPLAKPHIDRWSGPLKLGRIKRAALWTALKTAGLLVGGASKEQE